MWRCTLIGCSVGVVSSQDTGNTFFPKPHLTGSLPDSQQHGPPASWSWLVRCSCCVCYIWTDVLLNLQNVKKNFTTQPHPSLLESMQRTHSTSVELIFGVIRCVSWYSDPIYSVQYLVSDTSIWCHYQGDIRGKSEWKEINQIFFSQKKTIHTETHFIVCLFIHSF